MLVGEGRGRIIFGDVGQGNVEELDLMEMGANYEWNIMEGTRANCKKSYCMRGNQLIRCMHSVLTISKKVQEGNDQGKAQSEIHTTKTEMGKTKLAIRY